MLLVFLFSMRAEADCVRMKDGSCYNSDYIGDDRVPGPKTLPIAEPPHPPLGIAVGEPNPNGNGHGMHLPHKIKKKHCVMNIYV